MRSSKYGRAVDRIDHLRDGGSNDAIIKLGYPSVDKLLGGGVCVGDLIVLAGDAGCGTSSLAMGIAIRSALLQANEDANAVHTADEAPLVSPRVLFLTGELTPDRAHSRLLGIAARVSTESMRTGDLDDISRARLAAKALELRDQGPLIEHLEEGAGALDTLLERMRSVQLVIVDGIESMLHVGNIMRASRDDTIADFVLALKRLAIAHEVALIVVTHMQTTGLQRRPRLDDLGGRGSMGVHADVVLGLFREELYQQDLGISGAAEVLLLKHREMPTAYADLYFDSPTLRFEDLVDEA
jgi:replicative DNA helicase